MRRLLANLAVGAFLMLNSALAVLPAPANAQTTAKDEACRGANFGQATDCTDTAFRFSFKSIVNVIIFVVGALAVLMIIVGAIRFVTSAGNDQAVEGARNTIFFAIIGLVVAFLAYAIVNFVIEGLT